MNPALASALSYAGRVGVGRWSVPLVAVRENQSTPGMEDASVYSGNVLGMMNIDDDTSKIEVTGRCQPIVGTSERSDLKCQGRV